jgi:hypothetical protein
MITMGRKKIQVFSQEKKKKKITTQKKSSH